MNRLTRDQIVDRALDLIDSARLDEKDRPNGFIVPAAVSLGWLQDGLDLAHNLFPFAGTIQSASLTMTAGVDLYDVPSEFITDIRDGIVLANDEGRLRRRGLDKLLSIGIQAQKRGKPALYALKGRQFMVRPVPDKTYTATVYFYQLPGILAAGSVPVFPSDLCLVEYVHLRGKEWLREVDPGTANAYLQAEVSRLVKAGLIAEASDDEIPFDRQAFPGGGVDDAGRNDWMGNVVS